jgi:hypothetical protein
MRVSVEWFDRYVHEVGRRLPKGQRADVEAELRSLLMDALQDRASEVGVGQGEASEEDQVAVLEELGPPAKVAAGYAPPRRYLIGPPLFDWFKIVVAAVLGAITLAHLVLLLLALWGEPTSLSSLAATLGRVFEEYLGAMMAGFGSVTLVFAILERTLPESVFGEQDEETWDPRSLPEVEDRSRIKVGELIVESVLVVFALVVFNFFPEWVGVTFVGSINDGAASWHMRPLLSAAFFALYLPWLNVLWVLRLALNVVLLRQGRWQRLTRLADLVLAICGVIVLSRMAFGPSLLTLEAIEAAELRRTLESFLPLLLKVALIIGLFAAVGEVVRKLVLIVQVELGVDKLSFRAPGSNL